MKIIIDIPEELYKTAKTLPDYMCGAYQKALRKGILLDDITKEIEETANEYDFFDDYRRIRGLHIALDIINKYTEEQNDT